jgi:hypothetical protein
MARKSKPRARKRVATKDLAPRNARQVRGGALVPSPGTVVTPVIVGGVVLGDATRDVAKATTNPRLVSGAGGLVASPVPGAAIITAAVSGS